MKLILVLDKPGHPRCIKMAVTAIRTCPFLVPILLAYKDGDNEIETFREYGLNGYIKFPIYENEFTWPKGEDQ